MHMWMAGLSLAGQAAHSSVGSTECFVCHCDGDAATGKEYETKEATTEKNECHKS